MTNLVRAIVVAMLALTVTQPGPPYPVIVVDNPQEVRRAVDVRVDGTFTPSQQEAEAPRRDLARYLEAESRGEKSKDRQDRLHQIGLVQDKYVWHCGGYKKGRQKYLFCTFVWREPGERLLQKTFPVIKDGGISVCYCHFSMKRGRIVRLEWNGEA